jgi:hypothetical protein
MMRLTPLVIGLLGSTLLSGVAMAEMEPKTPPESAEVYFISPRDGVTVTTPVTLRMGLRGMEVAPAGVEAEGTGHHHLLVDLALEEVDLGAPLPFTDKTVHFGAGQSEGEVVLEPGVHTLQLLFMDHRHVSFEPPVVSERITITVTE